MAVKKNKSIIAEGLSAETLLKIVKTDPGGKQTEKNMTVEQWRSFKKTSGCTYLAHQIT